MEENLGSLYFDFRARLMLLRQDLATADREMDSYRKKWEAPIRLGGAGGMGGGGSGSLSPATAAAVASVGGGPNVMGTSNGDVTWNLRQAVRDTGAKYGGGRSSRGGIGMEDGTPDARIGDVAGEFIQQSRIRGELGFSRENSRRAGVLSSQQDLYDQLRGHADVRSELGAAREASDRQLREQRNQDAVDESKYQSENSLMGKLKKPVAIRTLLRGTMAGLVIDAMAGELGNEANYQKAMQLAGIDSVSQSAATIGRVRGGLSAIPFIGGTLNSLANEVLNPIEVQNAATQGQLGFQDNRFSAGINSRLAVQQRGVLAAGPNSYTSAIRGIAGQRTGLVAGFQGTNQAAFDAFDKANPMMQAPSRVEFSIAGLSNIGLYDNFVNYGSHLDTYNKAMDERARGLAALRGQVTGQNNNALGINDQSAIEATRTADYGLAQSNADLARIQTQNQFRPGAADAGYLAQSASNTIDFYGERMNLTNQDKKSALNQISMFREQAVSQRNDLYNNSLFGTGMQYTPQVESPLVNTDRSIETQSDKMNSLNAAIERIENILVQATSRLGMN